LHPTSLAPLCALLFLSLNSPYTTPHLPSSKLPKDSLFLVWNYLFGVETLGLVFAV
jgi:hypothetical protein